PATPPGFGMTPAVVQREVDRSQDVTDEEIKSVDLDLDNDHATQVSNSFADEAPTGNIWHQVDEDESDTPAFLRRRKKDK
ncbi:MAG: hypothetical protein WAT17_02850, partial [Candidatus Saccharimonadales bacterium]